MDCAEPAGVSGFGRSRQRVIAQFPLYPTQHVRLAPSLLTPSESSKDIEQELQEILTLQVEPYAEKSRQPVLFIWSVRSVWFGPDNQTDRECPRGANLDSKFSAACQRNYL